jgi:hypothetical protein
MSRRLMALVVAVSLMALAPAAAQAAAITGTVSDETTHVGIAGVEVCPTPQPYTFEVACVQTDSSGHYYVGELPPAQYRLYFSGGRNNLPYVSEFFDDKLSDINADLVSLNSGESQQVDAALAQGGSISGTLTDEDSGEPVANMAACAYEAAINYQRCSKSDENGHYQINGLPSAEYFVEYEAWNQVNYLNEIYDGAERWAQATRVAVAVPATTTGIDAELAKGAQILGYVTQANTGLPMPEVFVCAERQSPGEYQQCDLTEADGSYALIGLPAGTYFVAFGREYIPIGPAAAQWWQGVANFDEATPIVISPPETRTDIDGQIDRPIWESPPETAPAPTTPAPVLFNGGVPPMPRGLRPPKCKKGFHRKLVKGKKRCVRKHLRHHGHHRRHH